jgi:hypothetical protein
VSVGGETSASASSEEASTRRSLPEHRNGKRSAEAQGGVRTSSNGRHFARKAEGRSRDRGCNDHRILRRVPCDGRHPGQSRAIVLHGAAVTAALAAFSPIRSARQPSSEQPSERRPRERRARVKTREHERQEREATGMSEARSNRHRGKKTPTLANPSGNGKDARRRRIVSEKRSAEAFRVM